MMKTIKTLSKATKQSRQSGNIFFMLIGAVALIGAMTVTGGNVVKGIVTSMSEVTRKSVAEEKMQAAARLAIQSAVNCDTDTPFDFTEPLPFRDPGTSPHPVGGGLVPENIGATLRDPWGTEYGYCAWNLGNGVCTDSPNRINGGNNPASTVVAVISAGKDRRFSSTCGNGNVPANCAGMGDAHVNDSVTGSCFYKVNNTVDWDTAQASCQANGGYLAVPSSAHLNQLIWENLRDPGDVLFLGATELDVPGEWRWKGGPLNDSVFWTGESAGVPTPGMYNNWAAGEPNLGPTQSCLQIGYANDGLWDDMECSFPRGYICEIPPTAGGNVVAANDGNDDLVFQYTYNDAIGLGGDELWRIIDTQPGTAGIDRNIDVAGGAELTGPLNLMRAGLILPGDDATGPCAIGTDQQLRINFSNNPAVLELCDFTGGNGWSPVSMGDGRAASDCTGLGDAYYNDPVSGHCYYRGAIAATWSAAQTACTANAGYLATITSATEQDMLDDNFPYNESMWIGIHEPTTDGEWFYAFGERAGTQFWSGDNTGAPVGGNFNNWDAGEPNNSIGAEACGIVVDWSNGQWHDGPCGETHKYICEIPAGARPAGGVTRVQYAVAAQADGSTDPVTATLPSAPTEGNLLVAIAGHRKSSGDNSISGTGWTQHVNFSAHSGDNNWRRGIAIWSKIAGPTEPASITVDLGNENASLILQEFSALNGTFSFDNYAQTTGPASDTTSVSTGTTASTSSAVSLSIATAVIRGDAGTIEWTDGISDAVSPPTSNNLWFSSGYRVNNTSGTQSSTANYSHLRASSAAIVNFSVTPNGGGTAPTNGLVGYWPFNDAATARQDASGNNHNATWGFGGTPNELSWTASGRIGGGAISDASPDGAAVPDHASLDLSSYSLSAWINPSLSPDPFSVIITKNTPTTTNYVLYMENDGTVICGHTSGGVDRGMETAAGTVSMGSWAHLTCTYDNVSKIIRIYRNGAEVANSTLTGNPQTNNMELWFGYNDEEDMGRYNGLMDEVRIYNRALTPSEVTNVYTDGSAGGDEEEEEDANRIPDTFLIHPEMPYCTTAAPGPLVRVAESDNSNAYRFLTKGGDYLFSGGLASGISAFRINSNNTVTRLDTQSASGGNSAAGMYYDGTYIFSANVNDDLVAYTFDGTEFTEVAAIDTPSNSLDVTGDRRYLYVADSNAIRAHTFDGTTFTQAGEYAVSGTARQVWSDGRYLYVSAYDDGLYILTFNGVSFNLVQHLDPPGNVFGTAGDGKYLYVGEGAVVNIYSFNGTSLTQVGTYDPGGGRSVWTFSGDGKNLFFGLDNGELVVARFNGDAVNVLSTAILPDLAYQIRSDGNLLYVTLESGPMQIFSGVGCLGESSRPAGIASAAINPYDGKLAIARGSACAIKPDNSVWCWGGDNNGILGVNSTVSSTASPVRIHDPNGYKQIVGGIEHMCGLRIDGTAWCWGSDYISQLGNGSPTDDQLVPSAVDGGRRWTKLAAGNAGMCGIEETGDLYCWGSGSGGRIGDGGTATRSTPRLVNGGHKWSDVTATGAATCGIDVLSQLWCWGNNTNGRLGLGQGYGATISEPRLVAEPGPWVRVSAINGRVCGIKTNGTLWCWGLDANGSTGVPSMFNATSRMPNPVADPGPWTHIAMNEDDISCGIKQDGSAWCWGMEVTGNFGNGAATGIQRVPDRVLDPGPWANIQPGPGHTCGIKQDGSAWCWGTDLNGRLGNGAALTGQRNTPSRVVDFPGAATWLWDETARNISAGGAATANISLGENGVMGYHASGRVHNCAGLGNSHYNDPATGHCYYKVNSATNWDDAAWNCGLNNGYLAVISSNEEQTKLQAAFGTADQVWLGARDDIVEGEWRFTGGELDGELFWIGAQFGTPQNGHYNNWGGEEPNGGSGEGCMAMYWDGWPMWDDSDCGMNFRYICEIGTAGIGGGISFPGTDTLLRQYNSGSELLLETTAANVAAQIAWGVPAGNDSRALGISHTTGDLILGMTNTAMTNWMNTITPQMKISPDGRVGVGVTGSVYTKLDINGGLRVGTDNGECNAMREGTLRYVGGAAPFEYCNGTTWVAL